MACFFRNNRGALEERFAVFVRAMFLSACRTAFAKLLRSLSVELNFSHQPTSALSCPSAFREPHQNRATEHAVCRVRLVNQPAQITAESAARELCGKLNDPIDAKPTARQFPNSPSSDS